MLPRLHISVSTKYCSIIVPSPLIITLAVAITVFTITNSIIDDGGGSRAMMLVATVIFCSDGGEPFSQSKALLSTRWSID